MDLTVSILISGNSDVSTLQQQEVLASFIAKLKDFSMSIGDCNLVVTDVVQVV